MQFWFSEFISKHSRLYYIFLQSQSGVQTGMCTFKFFLKIIQIAQMSWSFGRKENKSSLILGRNISTIFMVKVELNHTKTKTNYQAHG